MQQLTLLIPILKITLQERVILKIKKESKVWFLDSLRLNSTDPDNNNNNNKHGGLKAGHSD